MFLTTFFGSIFMMGPTLPLLYFKPKWFRNISDKLIGTWLGLPVVSIVIILLFISLACVCFLINFLSFYIMWFSYKLKAILGKQFVCFDHLAVI